MKDSNFKIIASFFVLGVAFLSFVLFVNHSSDLFSQNEQINNVAAVGEATYVPISGVDFSSAESSNQSGFAGVLSTVFVWMIRIIIALAIVSMVWGAVQYMTTDAIYDKKDGRKRMGAAIGGLILALISWLILNTINPNILNNNFLTGLKNLGEVSDTPAGETGGVGVGSSAGGSGDSGDDPNP